MDERVNSKAVNTDRLAARATRRRVGRLIVAAVIALVIFAGIISFKLGYRISNGASVDSPPGKEMLVYIHDNMTANDVATLLLEKGLLVDRLDFVIHAKIKGYNPSRYTGGHTLNSAMNAETLVNELMNVTEKQN